MKKLELLNETIWNQLLLVLDKALGFEDKINSSVKKVSQHYDEIFDEHVIVLQYRVKANGKGKQKTRTQKPGRELTLIKQINDLAKQLAD